MDRREVVLPRYTDRQCQQCRLQTERCKLDLFFVFIEVNERKILRAVRNIEEGRLDVLPIMK